MSTLLHYKIKKSAGIFALLGRASLGDEQIIIKNESEKNLVLDELKKEPACFPLTALHLAFENEILDLADQTFKFLDKNAFDDFEVSENLGPENIPQFTKKALPSEDHEKQRLAQIKKMATCYLEGSGFTIIRSRLAEGLAIGLAKKFGKMGQYGLGIEFLKAFRQAFPYSYHLRTSEAALKIKMEGRMLPPALEKFVGDDNEFLKERVCFFPFKRFDIGPNGDVLLCCGHWLPRPVGNILKQETSEILNSTTAKKIRESMLDGSFKYCNHLDCPHIAKNTLPKKTDELPSYEKTIIEKNQIEVKHIEYLLFAFDKTCNLSCPSCRTQKIVENVSENEAKADAIAKKIRPLLETCNYLHINAAGELFFSKPSRKILEYISDETTPNLRLDIISNGTLFTEDQWNRFQNIHKKINYIRISTDSCKKDTFEKLRRGGKWDEFHKNLKFLSSLRARNVIPGLRFSFTYQKQNYEEMKEFVLFCRKLNADFIIFEKLQNMGAFSNQEYLENAVHFENHPEFNNFRNVISDPIFKDKDVALDFIPQAGL